MDNTVAIIDDHDIVRLGLETLLRGSPQLRVVGSASCLADGLALIGHALIGHARPALVITDMGMGDSSGLATVRAVLAAQHPRYTLVLSMHDEMLYGEQALALGADGYIMKDRASAEVVPAALKILAGGAWISPRLEARMRARHARGSVLPEGFRGEGTLTVREREVLDFVRAGRSTKEIARSLGLSNRTVDIHRANIKRKLGLRTGAEIIASASLQVAPPLPGTR